MAAALANKMSLRAPAKVATRPSRASRSRLVTRASGLGAFDPYLTVSAATAAMLAVGRIAFLPLQRRSIEGSNEVPKTSGMCSFRS